MPTSSAVWMYYAESVMLAEKDTASWLNRKSLPEVSYAEFDDVLRTNLKHRAAMRKKLMTPSMLLRKFRWNYKSNRREVMKDKMRGTPSVFLVPKSIKAAPADDAGEPAMFKSTKFVCLSMQIDVLEFELTVMSNVCCFERAWV